MRHFGVLVEPERLFRYMQNHPIESFGLGQVSGNVSIGDITCPDFPLPLRRGIGYDEPTVATRSSLHHENCTEQ
jgi:hypothetical protein